MRVLAVVLAVAVMFSLLLAGCSKSEDTAVNRQAAGQTTDNQKKDFKRYQDMGLEVKQGDLWGKSNKNRTFDGLGDSENPNDPIYNGLTFGFISNELNKEYETAKAITDEKQRSQKIEEIFAKTKSICAFAVFRKDKIPTEDKLAGLTKFKHNEKLKEIENYVFYFAYNDYDDTGLSAEDKAIYKKMYDDMPDLKKTAVIFKPITPQEAMTALGKIEFKLKGLDGKEYASADLFKQNKLTMINIWATFCGPCKRELPDLQKVYEEMAAKNVNVIGIIGDTPDPDNEAAAVRILEVKGVKYLNLIPDDKFKKDVVAGIAGYPTTIFVDANGNIAGKVITGDQPKEEYSKAIGETLKTLK